MNKNKLKSFLPKDVLLHPQDNPRCIFYSLLLAKSLKLKYENIQVDIILPAKYSFLRELLYFKTGKLNTKKYYDFYISLNKDFKTIYKYRIINARVKFGIGKFLSYKFFDFLLPNEDNPKLIIEDMIEILGLEMVYEINFRQIELNPYIMREKVLFLTPYSEKITNMFIHRIKTDYKVLSIYKYDIKTLLTKIIHNYKKIIVINDENDHFISFILKNKAEIVFSAVNYKEHVYSVYSKLNPVKYVCSPCNVNSVKCPLKYQKKKYLCLKKGIYSF